MFNSSCKTKWLAVECVKTKVPLMVYDRNKLKYEGWNFNSGNYLFTTDTK